MTEPAAPRVVIDFQERAVFGDPESSLRSFEDLRRSFGRCREVWLFNGPAAPLVRCFYYPPSAPDRYGIPRGQGPKAVLIDENGDQLWLSGISCGEAGARSDVAATVLTAVFADLPVGGLWLDSLPLSDEMHFLEGDLVGTRPLTEPSPVAPPGKTFIRNGRLVCRMEYDKDSTTPLDLRTLWALATEPHGWLGRPLSLVLYDDRTRSEGAGDEGCQLVAVGESRRELFLQFPEPDTYERLAPGATRVNYAGAFTEYEAVKAEIFRSVGAQLDQPDDRRWRDRILLRYREPPPVIRWP